ncbi:MAG: hypothetical protein R3D03_13470 [Geminicoccaceae bacterium]
MMSKSLRWLAAVLMVVGAGKVAAQQVTHLGQNWSDADRTAFYTTSIGSQIMPQAWFWAPLSRPTATRASSATASARGFDS